MFIVLRRASLPWTFSNQTVYVWIAAFFRLLALTSNRGHANRCDSSERVHFRHLAREVNDGRSSQANPSLL